MEVIGKGSYGYVSRASCKVTGRDVALKILFNEPSTEYETIKVLREIQLMRKLNESSELYFNEVDAKMIKNGKNRNPKGIFVPELIDIITPPFEKNVQSKP